VSTIINLLFFFAVFVVRAITQGVRGDAKTRFCDARGAALETAPLTFWRDARDAKTDPPRAARCATLRRDHTEKKFVRKHARRRKKAPQGAFSSLTRERSRI